MYILFSRKERTNGDNMSEEMQNKVVAFIDILGFKNIVENTEKAFSIVNIISNIKKEKLKIIKEVNNTGIEITWFSDCIVISSFIEELTTLLEILTQIQSELIKQGILIRGGIEFGECFHKNEKLFGMAMNRAYEIESKISIVPRIVLSKNLMQYINSQKNLEEKSIESSYDEIFNDDLDYTEDEITYLSDWYINNDTITSEIHKNYVLEDVDGNFFVNYLDHILDMCLDTLSFEEMHAIYDGNNEKPWSENEKEMYSDFFKDILIPLMELIKDNLKGNNINVTLKYLWLKNYYNSRIESKKKILSKSFKNEYYHKLLLK